MPAACISTGFAANKEDLVFGPIPTGGTTISHLKVEASASTTATITALDNGTATTVTCTMTAGTTCSDDTHSAFIAEGHYVEVQVANANAPDAVFVAAFIY